MSYQVKKSFNIIAKNSFTSNRIPEWREQKWKYTDSKVDKKTDVKNGENKQKRINITETKRKPVVEN